MERSGVVELREHNIPYMASLMVVPVVCVEKYKKGKSFSFLLDWNNIKPIEHIYFATWID